VLRKVDHDGLRVNRTSIGGWWVSSSSVLALKEGKNVVFWTNCRDELV
jgi:hypothetical protein